MIQSNNPYRSLKVEFHILQSFPVTCLNRDDVGAPKTAVVGGTTRARVSSQCWKRHVRLALHDLNIPLGTRTKLICALIKAACIKLGATEEQAVKCGEKIEQVFIKTTDTAKKGKKGKEENEDEADTADEKSDTLLFLAPSEIDKIANKFKEAGFDPEKVITKTEAKKQAKEVADIIGKPNFSIDGLDIALFGRMVAQAASMNVEAAASFAHAISTHKVTNEVEFFTALDDEQVKNGIAGSGHMGSLEFNAATYYRYVSLDIGQLWENLGGVAIKKAVEAFVKALYVAVPNARQTSQSGASAWEYAKVLVRKGQRLQVPFETAIRQKDGGFYQPSKEYLDAYLTKKEKLAGSLFGKKDAFSFGDDESFNVDRLIEAINTSIEKE
jgi:CRISPR system Cascade subunit CasC